MWRLFIRRFVYLIPQLFFLSMIVFWLARFMPGDALTGWIDPNLDSEMIETQRIRLGLNNPWYVQYFDWLNRLVTEGDLGQSFQYQVAVTQLIRSRLFNSLYLGTVTLILTYIIAIPLGVWSGRFQKTWIERWIVRYTNLGLAMPLYILGLLMLFLFGFKLGWFPTSGSVDVNLEVGSLAYYASRIHHLFLPALSIALISSVSLIHYLRSEVIRTKQQPFIQTARVKGVKQSAIYHRHVLKPSLIPIASFFGLELTRLISGTIFIETIYSYPGMGSLFIESIMQRDFTVVVAIVLLFGLTTIIGSFLSDLLLYKLDPRIQVR
ncbi:peptide/nickel transport system permease protein [Pelagirhabdus alkalitolerans]|uniref:Peptide/nickel transport system permease protein n=1 Tax=Pelagirhabdus alkalitolerans TaxID=1612202 RepID=A0A1G6MLF4_9BACI|nr:ABC transporter permease [Pelagirhabdus alkalitolerans]SDC56352.1 peptide/nickel transport system permease protein [Pelagirhabdus alkalitolerans]